jgi:hypothetical protein
MVMAIKKKGSLEGCPDICRIEAFNQMCPIFVNPCRK